MKASLRNKFRWMVLLVSACVCFPLLLLGCLSAAQQSDWRWQEYNPDYREPYPRNPGPFGSPEEVRREVRRLAELVGTDRRSILMPSNVIQPETPWENIVAFAEEGRALRRGGESC